MRKIYSVIVGDDVIEFGIGRDEAKSIAHEYFRLGYDCIYIDEIVVLED
jgi:hypothetical protein